MSPLKLRPHHGLCIPHFQGRGYSPAFVGQMEKVIAALQNNPPVQMVTGGDEICKACPNRQEGVCCYEEKVSRYDQQVLKYCRVENGQTLPWQTFADLVQRFIIATGRLAEICGDCQWAGICHSPNNSPKGSAVL